MDGLGIDVRSNTAYYFRCAQRQHQVGLAMAHGTEQRVVQNEIGRSLKLSHKRETKLDIRLQRIKRCRVVQFGERRWSNDELHFNAART